MKTTVKTLRCIQAVIAGAIMSVVSITGGPRKRPPLSAVWKMGCTAISPRTGRQ